MNLPNGATRHLLGLDGWSSDQITMLLDAAKRYLPVAQRTQQPSTDLRGRLIANMFLEDSTRTRGSFTVAAMRLGAQTIELTGKGSSLSKGESLLDTAWTIESFGVDAIVMRTNVAGGAAMVAQNVRIPVINAGDGRHEHPTQGLLDLLTMREHLGTLAGRRIAIVGDIANSRVARSNIFGLTTMGATVVLIGPPTLAPASLANLSSAGTIEITHDLDAQLESLDAIMMLRVQFERGSGIASDYRQLYSLTEARAARLPEQAVVLHPGPMNRGLEIDAAVADDPKRSVIREQVTNGVAVRMAALAWVLESV